MSTRLTLSLAVVTLALSAPLAAQARSIINGTELDAAVAARPAGNREAVKSLLATPEARQVAAHMGVNASELSARVASLNDASLNRLAERARASQRDLAGGSSTIVISTTTVIIGLLILILLTS